MPLLRFFDIGTVWFQVWDYPVSYVEAVGTVAGLAAVWLAARDRVLTWPVGLFNIVCFWAIFWQVHLYSDVFLQTFFFATGVYGWYSWRDQLQAQVPVQRLPRGAWLALATLIGSATLGGGWAMTRVHLWLPSVFAHPAAYPYLDTFIASASVAGQILLARRVLENWVLWIAVDAVAVFVYADRGIRLVSLEYALFLGLAVYGLVFWYREWKSARPVIETSGTA